MELKELEQKLKSNPQLRSAAGSETAKKLLERLDGAAVERAAKQGDTAALQKFLAQALSTPEGKALAEQVRNAVDKHNG